MEEGRIRLRLSHRPGPLLALLRCTGVFLISLHSGASRHGTATSPGDNALCCSSLLTLSRSVFVPPSFSPTSQLFTHLSLSSRGIPPQRGGTAD